ncbi:MAG: lipopolysaccharide heptosyltransferase II [Candidatus Omnitrophica bacterium]|nr:lipopolysaccharide heptosyltransferase II [Candidatus Omnitrophota bacterium]
MPFNPPPKRILVTRTDRIGDLVLSTPVFEALRQKFPKAWIACLTFVENRQLVEGNPFLDEVILYDKKGTEKRWWENFIFALRLARKNFDIVIHLHSTHRMHWTGWLARIPVRIGWMRKSAWTLTHAFSDHKKEGQKHEAAYNFDLLEPLGISLPLVLKTWFPLQERDSKSLDQLLFHHEVDVHRPIFIVSPSASCPSKRWPAGSFAQVMEKLFETYQPELLVVGSKQDRSLVQQIRERTSVRFHDLTGRLSLGMLGQLLKRSALMISNDSGPVHIASAVGTPVISIFGRKQAGLSPERWRPLSENSRVLWKDAGCEVCLAHDCQIDFLCLQIISVEDVLQAVRELRKGDRLPQPVSF